MPDEARWLQIRSIAERALELSAAERATHLDQACGGDRALRAQVEDLIARIQTVDDSFLEPAKAPERHVLGDFEILRELGRGAMGAVVYLARQLTLGREVALKVLVETFTTQPRQIERFHRESRAAAKLRHPGIVQVFADGQAERTHWFAMEYVPGHDLARELSLQHAARPSGERAYLPRIGAPDHLTTVARICADVADALHYAHCHGLVHRDVKPQNIMLQPDGRVQVADFGLVRDESLGTLTREDDVLGTPCYMSPEQARASALVDHRTDVYSLGVVMYELCSLQRPFDGADLRSKILHDEPPRLRQHDRRIPRDLELICSTAMAKSPHERYADAKALAQDLQRFLRHEPILARPPAVGARCRRWLYRHRRSAAAAAILALGLAAGSLVTWRTVQAWTMASVSVEARDEVGRELQGTATFRRLDPLTLSVAAEEPLGDLPVRGALLAPGDGRIAVRVPGRDERELLRRLEAGGELSLSAVVGDVPVVLEGMVWIEGGVLQVRDAPRSSLNGRDVVIDSFWLDEHEVSNAEYRRFLEATAHDPPPFWSLIERGVHDDLPVVGVGWVDARAYAEWIGKRLPSFAEWTWAARGAEGRIYPWPDPLLGELRGNTLQPATAITAQSEGMALYLRAAAGVRSHPDARTGSGLFHMFGNVAELTESTLPEPAGGGAFVLRPGQCLIAGFKWDAGRCGDHGHTLANFAFDGIEHSYGAYDTGFRCARSATR